MGKEPSCRAGAIFHIFDWNKKSRKKLFSNTSDLQERSKQKERSDGNLSLTRVHLMDGHESSVGTSFRGSSEYSYASSVTDEEGCGTKAPGVVARLMGLDSLPSYFDSQYLHVGNSGNLQNKVEAMEQKLINRPIEKFQTEILPPKSAKYVPVTHQKLLSPIKSAGFIPSRNAACIMESAAKIVETRPQTPTKNKIPATKSSSVPIKVRELKAKVEAAQKPSRLSEASRKPLESGAAKHLKGQSMNKSWNGSSDTSSFRYSSDSEDCSASVKSKGKSVSLALQAKANVQKREGPDPNQKNSHRKPSHSASNVLKQNHRNQNYTMDREKLPLKPSNSNVRGRKLQTVDSSIGRHQRSNKKEVERSGTKDVTQKQHSIGGRFDMVINENVMPIQSKSVMDGHFGCTKDGIQKDVDVVSFTFTAPSTRSYSHVNEKTYSYGAENLCGKVRANSNANTSGKLSSLRYNVIGGDALSILLEQKLKESTRGVVLSSRKAVDTTPLFLSTQYSPQHPIDSRHINNDKHGMWDDMDECSATDAEARKLIEYRYPSPVSVLQPCSMTESCNSSDTIDNNSTEGVEQCSSVQAQDLHATCSLKTLLLIEAEEGLTDSATSTCNGTMTTSSHTDFVGSTTNWELDYVKEILRNVEIMFKDFATGRAREIVNPRLFDKLESGRGGEATLRRKVIFDCVSECMDLRLKPYACGGLRSWEKGLALVKRERFPEKVYRDILGLRGMGDCLVDELVDEDMSSHHGRWLNFEIETSELGIKIETQILSSLIYELVQDVLLSSKYMVHTGRDRVSRNSECYYQHTNVQFR